MLTFTAFMICHHQYLVHTDGWCVCVCSIGDSVTH
jgi:hypothetical protein